MLNELMAKVDNPQIVLETVVQVLTFDLKDYGIKFSEELEVKFEPVLPGQRPGKQTPLRGRRPQTKGKR
jgi:hypothetical protein